MYRDVKKRGRDVLAVTATPAHLRTVCRTWQAFCRPYHSRSLRVSEELPVLRKTFTRLLSVEVQAMTPPSVSYLLPASLPKVLSLPQLSERGTKHLEADLKYLSNVFHALDLPAPPVLEHVSLLAGLSRDEAATHLVQETVTGETKIGDRETGDTNSHPGLVKWTEVYELFFGRGVFG